MSEIKLRETMWATLKPDCYGGPTCDQIVHVWSTYADGDKDGDETHDALELDPRRFPPGTKVVISEPACPKCGETRWPTMKNGEFVGFNDKCQCGFDWKEWTLDEYS